MRRATAELIVKDPNKLAHHDRVFLNNPVVMQGMGLAPLVVLATSGQKDVYKRQIVPNTGHLKGMEAAVAAGIIAGSAEKELEVISEVSEDKKAAIRDYLQTVPISIQHIEQGHVFDIIAVSYTHLDVYKRQGQRSSTRCRSRKRGSTPDCRGTGHRHRS